MSFATVGPVSTAWTPDRESVLSAYTDAGSIYASLQRPHHSLQTKYIPQQQDYSRPPPLPGGPHPGRKGSFVALRTVNERSNSLRSQTRRYPGMTAGAGGDCGMGRDVIEVQILPQDDNWGDNTTAITGNTSVRSESFQELTVIGRDPEHGMRFKFQRYSGSIIAASVALFAFLSPIAMVLMPHSSAMNLSKEQLRCDSECDGLFISASFKLLILLLGSWAIFVRQPKATMPRIYIFRAVITLLIFIFTFSYWLFYAVRIIESNEEIHYRSIVYFAVSLVDALLFIHYLAVVLLEIRHLTPTYAIKVLRSPDGLSKWYNIGQLSIQRAAAFVLEKYYQDFPIYNPYLDRVPSKKKTNNSVNSSFKYYDVDGNPDNGDGRTRAVLAATARRRDSAHNERFYEEAEYDRRVRKRKARLLTAAEEAFTHIRRLHEENGTGNPMDPKEAAQAIFPSMARSLQKYLRITRQQPRHSMESILDHLAICLAHDMSPRAFLEQYLKDDPIFQNDKEMKDVQSWGLVCEQLLSRPISSGTVFQLRQSDVLLLCAIKNIPHFSMAEEIIHPKSNKFVLRLNSETSV